MSMVHTDFFCLAVHDIRKLFLRTAKRDGVGYRDLSGFNYVCLPFMIDYQYDNLEPITELKPSQEEALKALETLKLYIMKG